MADKTSFWNFIKNNRIEIPIIQRDYAQGRKGKEYLRKSFLSDLKKALDNEPPFKDTELKLDFVYGSTENRKLNPLDGQQRLTTLWLLHWYIALRAGLLYRACPVLIKFSYETRISSREFCEKLCEPKNFESFSVDEGIVDYITNQTWFYSAWKQDPTIQAMLRMLSGTRIYDKNGEDIVDGIEEIFRYTRQPKFNYYWWILCSDKSPIKFYHLALKDFGLSDDLYIKMNARGKQLTDFENFKADLIGYITRQSEEESLEESQQKEWKELIHPKDGIPIKIDTKWTDFFWENKSKENRIDEIYFAFINRFFLNELICQKDGNNKYVFTAKQLEEGNSVFSYLYGSESDDTKIEYVGIEKYKDIPLLFLKNLSNTLNRVPSDFNLSSFNPKWVEQDFQYIPIYNESSISSLEQKDRIAFHAITKYLQMGTFDAVSFRQWMRVVWNIVENAGVNSISSMIGVMRLIDELSIHSHEVYSFLDSQKSGKTITSNAAQEQFNQEINKAVQILHGEPRSDGKTWEKIIKEAEQFAFFKGSISFLFQDGDGHPKWTDFDTKWENAKKYFDTDGVKDDDNNNVKYKTDAILLKAVLYHVNDFWKYIEYQKFVFDNKGETWKSNILLEQGWEKAVHKIMMNDLSIQVRDDDCLMYKNLYNSNLLKYVAAQQTNSRINWIHGHRALYPPRYEGILLDDDNNNFYRNSILFALLSDHLITSNQKIECCDFFKGWDVNFYYIKDGSHVEFQWNTDNHVYLVEEGKWVIRDDKIEEKYDKYYCFDASMIKEKVGFRQNLDDLIELVSKDKS